MSDEDTLTRRDIQTLLTIVNDVYPVQRQKHTIMTPLLMGVGIGLMMCVLFLFLA